MPSTMLARSWNCCCASAPDVARHKMAAAIAGTHRFVWVVLTTEDTKDTKEKPAALNGFTLVSFVSIVVKINRSAQQTYRTVPALTGARNSRNCLVQAPARPNIGSRIITAMEVSMKIPKVLGAATMTCGLLLFATPSF